jgi:hypothetical protein
VQVRGAAVVAQLATHHSYPGPATLRQPRFHDNDHPCRFICLRFPVLESVRLDADAKGYDLKDCVLAVLWTAGRPR